MCWALRQLLVCVEPSDLADRLVRMRFKARRDRECGADSVLEAFVD